MFKKLIREPLLHFLLIGAVLFGLSWWVDNHSSATERVSPNDEIVITNSIITGIKNNFQQHTGSQPTEREMLELLQEYINREMLYREALKVGLDKNNDSLKTLLAEQMSVAYTSDKSINSPTDEEMKQLLADKSWYANDSGLPDTSEVFIQLMKPKLRSRYQQLKMKEAIAEKMKTLAANYQVIRKDSK